MTSKLVLSVFSCFACSIAIVIVLAALSKDIRETPGSFLRQYPPHPVIESKKIQLNNDHYYFSGATVGTIYLANTQDVLRVLAIDTDMSDTNFIRLNINIPERLKFYRVTVAIDSPYYYFMDGAVPFLHRGNIMDWKAEPLMTNKHYFLEAIPISPTLFAVSALSAKTNERVLGILDVNSNEIKLNHKILQKQFDGVFDVDGSFSYNKVAGQLLYVYYYRNQYIAMDTNLHVQYRGNTIDTFSVAHIKTSDIYSGRVTQLSAPPIVTNKSHTAYKQWLFVHSLLPARNEYMKQFEQASIIDVYDLKSNSYQFSFHVFDEDGKKMKSFQVVGDKLFVLFNSSIRKYDLIEKYFPAAQH